MSSTKQWQRGSSSRQQTQRLHQKRFIIATEGMKTEPQYFSILNNLQKNIQIICIKRNHPSPDHVLQKIKKRLEEDPLEGSDEAWVVVDKDDWADTQIKPLHEWANSNEKYGFALSNPAFELWLLLHFEDGKKINNASSCKERLIKHLPDYDKSIKYSHFNKENIHKAIKRAIELDKPPCDDWPRRVGVTTVYRLLDKILPTSNTD